MRDRGPGQRRPSPARPMADRGRDCGVRIRPVRLAHRVGGGRGGDGGADLCAGQARPARGGSGAGATIGATVAAGLLALDVLHLVLSRVAMLDVFLALFVVAGFVAILLDLQRGPRPAGRGIGQWLFGRPWRLAAGLLIGAMVAVKWTGLYSALGIIGLVVAWEIVARRRGDGGEPVRWGRAFGLGAPRGGRAYGGASWAWCRCSCTSRPISGWRRARWWHSPGARAAGGGTSPRTRWPWPASTPDSRASTPTSRPRGRGSS